VNDEFSRACVFPPALPRSSKYNILQKLAYLSVLFVLLPLVVLTGITRHDCVEGWSAIGKWHGVPLGMLLNQAQLSSQARYLVFHCADDQQGAQPHRHGDGTISSASFIQVQPACLIRG